MTDLADRLLAQLRRLGSMAAASVPLSFGVAENEASSVIKELCDDKRAYRAGARIFASSGAAESSSPPIPAGQQRQIKMPPTPLARAVPPTAPVPRESTQEAAMAETKVCTKCAKRKPIDDFYDKQGKCKRCFLDDQKAAKAARGGGSRKAQKRGAGEAPPPGAPAQRHPQRQYQSRTSPSSTYLRVSASGRSTRLRRASCTCPSMSTSRSGSCSSWQPWLRQSHEHI